MGTPYNETMLPVAEDEDPESQLILDDEEKRNSDLLISPLANPHERPIEIEDLPLGRPNSNLN